MLCKFEISAQLIGQLTCNKMLSLPTYTNYSHISQLMTLHLSFLFKDTEVQPNREILAPPGVDSEQDKEQVLSIGKHPSLMKVKMY